MSTTKLRIVYDDLPSIEGQSLNQCPESSKLSDIFIRFCSYKVVLINDIKQAFLNVSVKEPDRDFLQFLWVKDISSEKIKIIVCRFARVAFGTTASQF